VQPEQRVKVAASVLATCSDGGHPFHSLLLTPYF